MMKIILSLITVLTLAMSGCTGPGNFFDEDKPVEEPYVFDLTIEDTQCGFKAIDKEKFPTCKNFTTDGFSFDIELILLALKSGLRIRIMTWAST